MSRTKRFICVIALLWIAIFSEFSDVNASTLSSEKIHLVFIGNSITYGATLGNPAEQAPPIVTGRLIYEQTGKVVRVKNGGVSGITTFGFLPGRSAFENVVNAADVFCKESGPLYFLIMLGTNDSAEAGTEGAPVSTTVYKQNMKSIINALLQRYPKAKIIINYPIWYSPTTYNGAKYLQAGLNRLKSYHPIIDEIVKEYGVSMQGHVFPGDKNAYSFFENNTSFYTSESGQVGTFYLHPNAGGAVKLAQFWAGSIINLLEGDGIKIVDKSNELLLDSARQEILKCYNWSLNMDDPLIKNANQLLSNASGTGSEGSFGALIDRSYATWFQSDNKSDIGDIPNLQVDLCRDTLQQIVFTMMRRMDNNANISYNQIPADIDIYASNDTTDINGWIKIGGIHSGFPAISSKLPYASPLVLFDNAYRYLIFVVNKNITDKLGENGLPYYNMSEFQVYPAKINEEKSMYYQSEKLRQAVQELKALCTEGEVKLKNGTFDDNYKSLVTQGISKLKSVVSGIHNIKVEKTEQKFLLNGLKMENSNSEKHGILLSKNKKILY